MAKANRLPKADSQPEFCVVGIGASAGGLEALRTFFSRMPASPGFACVVVVHLSPEHESHLVDMLQPYVRMPVCQVAKTTMLEPGRVYVIPPNANLNSIDTHLRLSQLEGRRIERAPIDHFLRTLAETHGEQAIGVILTGAGSDGALGMRQIKEHGGLTIAQDPHEAEYHSMPESAVATGTVDLVLPLRDMAEEISSYCATQPWAAAHGRDGNLSEAELSVLEKILGEVRQRTGQEFAMFKPEMVLQRVRRRMRRRHVSSPEAYLAVLQSHPEEARGLHNDLLLNVTEFFRDSEFFATIEGLLQELLESKDGPPEHVRVWSIGCSTGEEAYSLAMLLLERTSVLQEQQPRIQIFASELSADVLQHAREGIYPQEIAASISQERLERFFVHENGRYRVRPQLRAIVTFANHDLFKDPPYSHLDLIVCRNLLRDLQPAMRRGALHLFYYALDPQGVLLVDERNDELQEFIDSELFTRDAARPGVLRRTSGPRRVVPLPAGLTPFARSSGERGGTPVRPASFDTPAIFRRAIDRYTPPSVLVDSENQVVHFSANASRYVHLPGGELTHDILKLVPRSLARRLQSGLQRVRLEQRSWHSEPIVLTFDDGRTQHLTLHVDRTNLFGHMPELLLVVFAESSEPPPLHDPVYRSASEQQMLEEVGKLQAELEAVHGQLAAVSRIAPGGPQPQRNEELREVVEALDSAREELQAVNEELLSVNEENHHRIEALSGLSTELQHLLELTGFATIVLDRDLKVVRFTPSAARLLRLREADLGRPLAELRHHLRYEGLIADLRPVVEQQTNLEIEVQSDDGRWYMVRAEPYQTVRQGLVGAMLLFVDITDRKRAELALRNSDRRKEEFLAVLAHELRNPLAPIVAGIELLRKIPDDPALLQRVIATMSRQARQLVRLVDDLLEVVRINEDKLTLRIQRVSVAEVVSDAIAATRPVIENLQHQLTVEVPQEALLVSGDSARLTQVVGNLLNNAARYTPARGKIAVRVRSEDEQVLISVSDSGRGLSAQSLKNVFEMFYQAGEAGVSSTGLGIGLTLARKLVEMHGGTIKAESAGPSMGSTFTISLPLFTPESAGATPEAAKETEESVREHRVLIVDDNTDAAESLRLLMKSLGSGEVCTAYNGPDALEAAAKLRPDVVLLDLGMPGMDGYELARRMRAESWGKEAMLVALTGWGQDQYRRRSEEAGFDRHMIKPADVDALRSVLNSC